MLKLLMNSMIFTVFEFVVLTPDNPTRRIRYLYDDINQYPDISCCFDKWLLKNEVMFTHLRSNLLINTIPYLFREGFQWNRAPGIYLRV